MYPIQFENDSDRYALPAFLILTPLVSIGIALFSPLPPLLAPVFMALVPSLMALLLTAMAHGRNGVAGLLRTLLHWRIALKWYAVAVGLPLAIALTIALLALFLGWIPALTIKQQPLPALLLIAVFVLYGAVAEDLGWRGYALPRLLARHSALVSALLIGIPWGLLHVPLYLPGMPSAGPAPLAGFLVPSAASVLLTWLFVQTDGNVPVTILCHMALNFFGTFLDGLTAAQAVLLMAVVLLALAVVLLILYGANLQRRSTQKPVILEAS